MAKAVGICSECPNPLTNPAAKTCSDKCRGKRSRRLKRISRKATERITMDPEHRELALAAQGETRHELAAVLREELRPVAREAITEDTYRALRDLVALTPRAVECIQEDLYSDDAMIRQRAYTLLTKYTIGHGALVRPDETERGGQMIVNFQLPRPGSEAESEEAAVPLEAEEVRTCDSCGASKPITKFVASSDRCVECYEQQRDIARRLMDGSES